MVAEEEEEEAKQQRSSPSKLGRSVQCGHKSARPMSKNVAEKIRRHGSHPAKRQAHSQCEVFTSRIEERRYQNYVFFVVRRDTTGQLCWMLLLLLPLRYFSIEMEFCNLLVKTN